MSRKKIMCIVFKFFHKIGGDLTSRIVALHYESVI